MKNKKQESTLINTSDMAFLAAAMSGNKDKMQQILDARKQENLRYQQERTPEDIEKDRQWREEQTQQANEEWRRMRVRERIMEHMATDMEALSEIADLEEDGYIASKKIYEFSEAARREKTRNQRLATEVSQAKIAERKVRIKKEKLQEKHEPTYPAPNSAGEWTPQIIQERLEVNYGVVQHAVKALSERKTTDPSARLDIGRRGVRQTWNEKQMKRVVDFIREESSSYARKRMHGQQD